MKKYIVFFVITLSIALVALIVFRTDIGNKKDDFNALVYKTETGFGYIISYNNKVLIKQDYIPAVQHNQSFCNFDDAQKVAELIIDKLKSKENPRISLVELKKLDIQLACPD